jgi:hypothetical protein
MSVSPPLVPSRRKIFPVSVKRIRVAIDQIGRNTVFPAAVVTPVEPGKALCPVEALVRLILHWSDRECNKLTVMRGNPRNVCQ